MMSCIYRATPTLTFLKKCLWSVATTIVLCFLSFGQSASTNLVCSTPVTIKSASSSAGTGVPPTDGRQGATTSTANTSGGSAPAKATETVKSASSSAGTGVPPTDGRQGATTSTANTSGGSAPAKATETILVAPEQLELLRYPFVVKFDVTNNTSQAVTQVTVGWADLRDGKTGWTLPIVKGDLTKDFKMTLGTSQRTTCSLELFPPHHAGTYTGTFRVNASGWEKSVALTIRSQGPWMDWMPYFPIVLFTTITLLGWLTSVSLDHWYTTKLPRVQQVVLLREHQSALSEFVKAVPEWEAATKIKILKTLTVAALDLSDIQTMLKKADTLPLAELQSAEQKSALSSHYNDIFWTALKIAEAQVPQTNLAVVVQNLDQAPRGPDPVGYKTALAAILTAPPAAVPPTTTLPTHRIGVDLTIASAEVLHQRIHMMDTVKALVLGVLVWISAYLLFFASNPSFGSIQDTFAVLLWALGLTSTGAQLVTSVKKT